LEIKLGNQDMLSLESFKSVPSTFYGIKKFAQNTSFYSSFARLFLLTTNLILIMIIS
jgi:hypothetical protein